MVFDEDQVEPGFVALCLQHPQRGRDPGRDPDTGPVVAGIGAVDAQRVETEAVDLNGLCLRRHGVVLVAGAAIGQPFAEPVEFHGTGRLHPAAQVDEQAAATLKFPGGAIAQLACGTTTAKEIAVRVYGTDGILHLPVPFHPGSAAEGPGRIILQRTGAPAEEIACGPIADLYTIEADTVGEAIARGNRECAAMSHADSLGNMAVLDAWRAAIGLRYDRED